MNLLYYCLPSPNYAEHVKVINFLNKIGVEITSADVHGRALVKVSCPGLVAVKLHGYTDVYKVTAPRGEMYVRVSDTLLPNGYYLSKVYTNLEEVEGNHADT